ncbi:hypothetical protein B14911_04294 [Bacillus sp. NRRL B-14911]|uniref:Uncharacterized protein n=1 Tax=Bacillus infantis NRRL B-14911 TaxID=1367477 RepID=U5LI58_9BACI|nr:MULTISPECIES: hypothetical protein [Bacillus]AGX06302.1 hypothetical protein N288_22310 [Bacillus infantis NRRL B-14911]EAR68775.1 hypothetical protein B14911_04294 [Bacillus sp. NRRL B-14911]
MYFFGTEEFFEEQLSKAVESGKNLSASFSQLERELNYNFICTDSLRRECLANLEAAGRKLEHHLPSYSGRHAAIV